MRHRHSSTSVAYRSFTQYEQASMKKSISAKKKSQARLRKRGMSDQLTAVRMPIELKRAVDAWADNQNLRRPDAVRSLVQRGLQAWIEELG
jgi:hypothetical protein